MDKRENGFWIASVSLVGAIIVVAAVYLGVDLGLGISSSTGSAAYDDFLAALAFRFQGADYHMILGAIIFYLGLALFLADAIFVVVKRSPRYIALGMAGVLGFVLCALFLQNAHYSSGLPAWYHGFAVSGIIVSGVLGLAAFVATFVFGRKLLKAASD